MYAFVVLGYPFYGQDVWQPWECVTQLSILEYICRDFTAGMLISKQLEREGNRPIVHPFRERTISEVSKILTEHP